MSGNGSEKPGATMEMTFDLTTFHLDVAFTGPALECAVAMCDQAKRHFEAQIRAAHALQIQQQMQQRAHDAALVSSLRNGAHRV